MAEDIFFQNKALQQLEYEEREIKLTSKPSILNLPIADKCNLKCFMCSISISSDDYKIHITPEGYESVSPLYPYLETLKLEGAEVFTTKEGTGVLVDQIVPLECPRSGRHRRAMIGVPPVW